MEPWSNRSFEYRRLLNPAFCADLLLKAMTAYNKEAGEAMPFSLSFLILPLCLFEDSRTILKTHKVRYFLKLLADFPQLLVGFSKRAKSLVPYTLEGLGYAFQVQAFNIEENGTLYVPNPNQPNKYTGTDEVKDCQKIAVYLGKAFAIAGSKLLIFSSLGVKP